MYQNNLPLCIKLNIGTLVYATKCFILLYHLHSSCTWRGLPCDITSDFSRVFTDVGVCYSFNSNKTSEQQLSMQRPGMSN